MKPFLFQLNYSPLVDQIALMASGNNCVLESQETYQKQSFRNRCSILTSQGILDLVIPIVHAGGNAIPIQQTRIDSSKPWAIQHWKSIHTAYNKSAYFSYYKHHFEIFYQSTPEFLFQFNLNILHTFCEILKIDFPSFNSKWEENPEDFIDLRTLFQPKKIYPFDAFPYYQTFETSKEFESNLSVYDLLFNLGPDAFSYLIKRGENLKIEIQKKNASPFKS